MVNRTNANQAVASRRPGVPAQLGAVGQVVSPSPIDAGQSRPAQIQQAPELQTIIHRLNDVLARASVLCSRTEEVRARLEGTGLTGDPNEPQQGPPRQGALPVIFGLIDLIDNWQASHQATLNRIDELV